MKKFKHQYKDGTLAWVDCTYASIYEVYVKVVREIMLEHGIRPIDVVALDVVIGGDHRLNALFGLMHNCHCDKWENVSLQIWRRRSCHGERHPRPS